MKENFSVEQIQITDLSKKRYELFAIENEEDELSDEVNEEIDKLAVQILDYIKTWRRTLPFEFIMEELTKLGWAPCLLYDDDGHWAISGEGMQSIPMDEHQETGEDWISHWVSEWHDTIRQALDNYLDTE